MHIREIFFVAVILIISSLFHPKLNAQEENSTEKSKRPTVGLVLSGGGAKGFAYIGLLKVIQEAKKRLEARKRDEDAEKIQAEKVTNEEHRKQGTKKRGPKRKHPLGEPKATDQENFTDPESRIMKDSKGFEQCYNAHVAVDSEERLIVANGVTNIAADVGQLIPMAEKAMANTNKPMCRLLADAGYRSEANFEQLENAQIDGFVSVGKEGKKRAESDPSLQATAKMKKKLETKRGRHWYRQRKHND